MLHIFSPGVGVQDTSAHVDVDGVTIRVKHVQTRGVRTPIGMSVNLIKDKAV